jgi:endonuclease/exonuclease/phosphatase family metal-dependent hydrolase
VQDDIRSESHSLKALLGRFATRRQWLASPGGAELAARLERHLARVLRFEPAGGAAPGAGGEALHVVHWNILHGDRYAAVARALQREPDLAGADLVSLNEADFGLARSGNRHVAFELARALGLHAVWTPLFLELEAGYGTPPEIAAQEQLESLFGLALLSRFPLGEVRRLELQTPEDLLFDRERHAGRFVGLVVEVRHPAAPFHVIATHLDVHSTPQLRQAQTRSLMAVDPGGRAVLLGDLNTTTFERGGLRRAVGTLFAMAATPRRALDRRVLSPHLPAGAAREPLFDELRVHGFEIDPFHDGRPSLDTHFDDVHELQHLPPALRPVLLGLLRPVERRCGLRLDWIVARGFAPVPERPPFVLPHLMRGPEAASDHAPIGVGLRPA